MLGIIVDDFIVYAIHQCKGRECGISLLLEMPFYIAGNCWMFGEGMNWYSKVFSQTKGIERLLLLKAKFFSEF